MMKVHDLPLVGRDAERARLEAGLEAALGGRGACCVLTGEAGIGKTRLADALASRAASVGARVAWGRCWEARGAPALWPWRAVVRSLGAEPGTPAATGGAGDDLGTLLSTSPGRSPDEGGSMFRLFEAAAGLLRSLAARAPVVLVFDDLHAADRPSLDLLRFVLRDLRDQGVFVVATWREAESRHSPAADALAAVAREALILPLRRLDLHEVATLLPSASLDDAGSLVHRVFQATEGNPLFVTEVARLLAAGRAGTGTDWAARLLLPAGVGEAIRAHLERAPASTREVLAVASVLGGEWSQGALAALCGSDVADALDLAAALQLVSAVEGARPVSGERLPPLAADPQRASAIEGAADRWRFTHILLREALYRGLPRDRRRELHRKAAGLCADPAVAADHALAAADGRPDAAAIEAALRGAAAEARGFAFEAAVSLLQRAMAVEPPETPELAIRLRLALGAMQGRAGDATAARATCRDAYERARLASDSASMTEAALTAGLEMRPGLRDDELAGLLEGALAALPPGDSALRARAMARLAAARQPAVDPAAPVQLGREAIAMARRLGDEVTLAGVLHAARAAWYDLDPDGERRALDRESAALAERLGLSLQAMVAHSRLAFDLYHTGELAEADLHVAEYARLAEACHQPAHKWRSLLLRSMRATMVGDFATADACIAQAEAHLARWPDATASLTLLTHRCGRLLSQRRDADLAALCPDLEAAAVPGGPMPPALIAIQVAKAHVLAGRPERARAGYHAGARTMFATIIPFYAEICEAVGDAGHAGTLHDGLASLGGRLIVGGASAVLCDGAADRALGTAAAIAGRVDEANAHFERALAIEARLGLRPHLARTQVAYATALLRTGDRDWWARAASLCEAARPTVEALDMPGLRAEIAALMSKVRPEASWPAGSASDAPSRRPPDLGPTGSAEPSAGTTTPRTRPDGRDDVATALRRAGEVWTVTWGGRTFHLEDSRGLHFIADLLARPDEEIHVLALAGGVPDPSVAGDAGPLLDDEARRAYRTRVAALRAALEEAEDDGDAPAALAARVELEALEDALAAAVGLRGRSRRTASATERARVNVQRRIAHALRRIGEHAPDLARILEATLRTGTFCSYRPM